MTLLKNIIYFLLAVFDTGFSLAVKDRCLKKSEYQDQRSLIVSTINGDILGQKQTQVDQRWNKTVTWTSYFDIPYAEPPVGNLRFSSPVPAPPAPTNCLLDATRTEDKICPQVNINFTLGSGLVNGGLDPKSDEDCLYLNIYVPETETDELLPVLFWIHGGGYTGGDGTSRLYGPLFYLSHDVIVVTIRYRLGPLGFLSLATEDVPGNAGVRDQVLGLQWVQDNIAMFGGNPDLVTINGQSAGSFASTYHIMSPMTKGLFKRAILQSGPGGFSPSYHHFSEERATKYGKLAAVELGCLQQDTDDIAACLRGKSVNSLLAVDYINELMTHPSIDINHSSDPYLPYQPFNIIQLGQYPTDMDIMIGVMEAESLIGTQIFIPAPDLFGVVRELWDIVGPYALLQKHLTEITQEDIDLATHILNHYCGPLDQLNSDKFDNFTKMTTDSFFWYGVDRFLHLHTQHATGNNYFYRIKYIPEQQYVWAPGVETLPGASHSDETILQWGYEDEYYLNEEDARVSLRMTTMWTNFVKFGNPTPDPAEVGVSWEPVTKDDIRFLVIDEEMEMDMDDDYITRMNFWDSLDLNISG